MLYYSLTSTKWLIIGIENNISTMTIPVISPDNSRHFATLDGILQQQQVVVSSCEIESLLFILFFIVLDLAVIQIQT